jgi:hypothetical protein
VGLLDRIDVGKIEYGAAWAWCRLVSVRKDYVMTCGGLRRNSERRHRAIGFLVEGSVSLLASLVHAVFWTRLTFGKIALRKWCAVSMCTATVPMHSDRSYQDKGRFLYCDS